MSDQIAGYLVDETKAEFSGHKKEFHGEVSNAAEFVLFKAVREDRVFIPRRDDLPGILKTLVALAKLGSNRLRMA